MYGGAKMNIHNCDLREFFNVCNEAALNPSMLPRIAGRNGENRFGDVLLRYFAGGRDAIVDQASVYPMRPLLLPFALASPGGGATRYEQEKHNSYAGILSDRQKLYPVVYDAFGAMGEETLAFLRQIAYYWGVQHSLPTSVAIPRVLARLGLCHARGIADCILRARVEQDPDTHSVRMQAELPSTNVDVAAANMVRESE